jgi:peptidyl-prolyl cis-trans isomerase A (cyclophilin A)
VRYSPIRSLILACIALLSLPLFTPTSAFAEDPDAVTQAKAFCDGMSSALSSNAADCSAMGKALSAHIATNEAFLRASTQTLADNQDVAQHCEKALSSSMELLAKCAADPEMERAFMKLDQIGQESRPQPPAMPPETPAYAPLPVPADAHPALTNPSLVTASAPPTYQVKFETSQGDFVVEVTREWAPNGADRFFNLVNIGYYNDATFFRAIEGFMIQFGISAYPAVNAVWREAKIQDDPVKQSNTPDMVTFATAGPNTRTTQLFININNNSRLDGMGFAPFGKVISGQDVVAKLYKGYGEGAPGGAGPRQDRVQNEGNAYLKADFPKLDFIKRASVVSAK